MPFFFTLFICIKKKMEENFDTKRKKIPMNFKFIAKNLSRGAIKSFIKELQEELDRRDEFNKDNFDKKANQDEY